MRPVDGSTDSTKIHPYSRDTKEDTVKYFFLHLFILQVISVSVSESPESDQNLPTGAPQVSTLVQGSGASQVDRNLAQVPTPVPLNVFTGTL